MSFIDDEELPSSTPLHKISLFFTERRTWNWSTGRFREDQGPLMQGGGCDTPEQALKEALFAIGWVSCQAPHKGSA